MKDAILFILALATGILCGCGIAGAWDVMRERRQAMRAWSDFTTGSN